MTYRTFLNDLFQSSPKGSILAKTAPGYINEGPEKSCLGWEKLSPAKITDVKPIIKKVSEDKKATCPTWTETKSA